MIRSEMVQHVQDLLAESTSSTAWNNPTILQRFINLSYQQIYAKIVQTNQKYFMTTATINLVSGTELYALPAPLYRIMKVMRVDLDEPRLLHPIDLMETERYPPGDATDEMLFRYYLQGANIGFLPAPTVTVTAAIKVWYIPSVTVFAIGAGGDASAPPTDWPAEHHEIIPAGAFMRCILRDMKLRSKYVPYYNQLEADLIECISLRDASEPKMIVCTDYD